MSGLRARAALALCEVDPVAKVRATAALATASVIESKFVPAPVVQVGRPQRPELVDFRQLPRRGYHTAELRAAVVHSVVHIEFNAINLALDAVQRFDNMPEGFYRDWAGVAIEEAKHFTMLCERLEQLGHGYGDFPAHDGLWSMAESTDHSLIERMALVPRFLEARGIDVAPPMIDAFKRHGDDQTAELIAVILDEEIGHVRVGTRWFEWACEQEARDPQQTFVELLRGRRLAVNPPVNHTGRMAAGFMEHELRTLVGEG